MSLTFRRAASNIVSSIITGGSTNYLTVAELFQDDVLVINP